MLLRVTVFLSVLMCVFFYFSLDPMKASLFLVLSLIFAVFVMSFGLCVWYSYYVCLVFLSGVFVIMVYFSSISSLGFFFVPWKFVFLLFSSFVWFGAMGWGGAFLGMNYLYYEFYLWVVVFLVGSLVFFLNFVSFFLVWRVALRSV